jgi:hypothetical protein
VKEGVISLALAGVLGSRRAAASSFATNTLSPPANKRSQQLSQSDELVLRAATKSPTSEPGFIISVLLPIISLA